jgi:hypothetical protein
MPSTAEETSGQQTKALSRSLRQRFEITTGSPGCVGVLRSISLHSKATFALIAVDCSSDGKSNNNKLSPTIEIEEVFIEE